MAADDARRINVGPLERALSIGAGVGLLFYGAGKRGWRRNLSFFLGGNLLGRGATGRSSVYRAFGVSTDGQARNHTSGVRAGASAVVRRPPPEVYAFWRRFENLPRFMRHLESVEVLDGRRSRWTIEGPGAASISWEAEIVRDIPGELITWQSLEGADVINAGSVAFKPAPEGTEVKVLLRYDPPGSALGNVVAELLGENPARQIEEDLADFKRHMESGAFAAA